MLSALPARLLVDDTQAYILMDCKGGNHFSTSTFSRTITLWKITLWKSCLLKSLYNVAISENLLYQWMRLKPEFFFKIENNFILSFFSLPTRLPEANFFLSNALRNQLVLNSHRCIINHIYALICSADFSAIIQA